MTNNQWFVSMFKTVFVLHNLLAIILYKMYNLIFIPVCIYFNIIVIVFIVFQTIVVRFVFSSFLLSKSGHEADYDTDTVIQHYSDLSTSGVCDKSLFMLFMYFYTCLWDIDLQ